MKRFLVISASISLLSIYSYGYKVEFLGVNKKVVEIAAEKNTGLDYIFVVNNASDITGINVTGLSGTEFEVSRYSNLGGGYAEEVSFTLLNNGVSLSRPSGNMGYIVRTSTETYAFWIVDYSSSPLSLQNIVLSDEQDCESTRIIVQGRGLPLHYYTIDGRQSVLSRDIKVKYETLQWNEEEEAYETFTAEKTIGSISDPIMLNPPFYCNTSVHVEGDRFLKTWNEYEEIESPIFIPNSVGVESRAEQTNIPDSDQLSNIIKGDTNGLGGSAPADISFYGFTTDAVLHTEWQMASDADFENLLYRFNEQDISYNFTEEGIFYLRFIGSNGDGSCEAIGDTYIVSIGASDLRIPNAFSPNNDGVNDVWKIGYRSLLDFKCWIFDSKGTQLFFFDDPALGWDGTYRGKTVNPGVYYYIIQATGADGKSYKRSGDINILNYKKLGNSTGGAEVTE